MNQLLTCILPQTIYLLWDHADLPMTPQRVFYDWPIHRKYHSGIYPRPAITLQRIVPQTCILLTCTCTGGFTRWYQTCFTLETIFHAFPPHIGQRFLRRPAPQPAESSDDFASFLQHLYTIRTERTKHQILQAAQSFTPYIGQRFLQRLPCTNIPSHATAHGSPTGLRTTCSPTTPRTRWYQTSQVTE
jgi:hypothetical protein